MLVFVNFNNSNKTLYRQNGFIHNSVVMTPEIVQPKKKTIMVAGYRQ